MLVGRHSLRLKDKMPDGIKVTSEGIRGDGAPQTMGALSHGQRSESCQSHCFPENLTNLHGTQRMKGFGLIPCSFQRED